MQFQCRRTEILNNIENKGGFDYFNQSKRVENCAIRDAMAQLKMNWHNSFGAFWNRNLSRQGIFADANFKLHERHIEIFYGSL
jgi:hypothetical protein